MAQVVRAWVHECMFSPAMGSNHLMPTPVPRTPQDPVWNLSTSRIVLALTAICVLRLAIAVAFYDPPRVWLHADDYCRALMAVYWAEAPYWYPGDLHWLPLPFYVNGLVASIGPQDARWPFVLVSQAAALLSILGVYAVARAMFSQAAALVAAALHAVTAWVAVMSYAALAEPIYYPLVVWGFAAYLCWWRGARAIHLLAACACLTLAAAARYEAWLFIIILGVTTLWRLVSVRPSWRQIVTALGCLLVAGAVPFAWVVENVRMQGTPLAFYGANRDDFNVALYHLPTIIRVFIYPVAFILLSPIILLITTVAMYKWRPWKWPVTGVLLAIVLSHLVIMTGLYTAGSGPYFVERIVLVHLLLLLPLTGHAMVQAWASRRGAARIAVAALLLCIGIVETVRAHRIIAGERYSDYAELSDHYEALVPVLRDELADPRVHLAIHTNDNALFLRFRTGVRDRLHAVTPDSAAELLTAHDIEAIYLPRTNAGHLVPDARIEKTWRDHHASSVIVEHDRGFWRVLEARP